MNGQPIATTADQNYPQLWRPYPERVSTETQWGEQGINRLKVGTPLPGPSALGWRDA